MFKYLRNISIPLFIITPFLGFVLSLFNLKSKSSAIIYIIFAMLFGFSISFSDTSADSFRYAEAFQNFDNTLNFDRILVMYQNGELRDMYRLLLFYFTSLFTTNPKVMYAFAGLVYGTFSYLSILTFLESSKKKWDVYICILGIVFFTFASLASVNGFRFNTGALVLYYSIYKFIILKKKFWVIGILITPFFHYGFLLIIPVLLIYKLIERFLYDSQNIFKPLYYFFILCFIASWFLKTNSINLEFLQESSLIGEAASSRMSYINSEDVAQIVAERAEHSLFLNVQKIFNIGIKLYVFLTIVFTYNLLKRFGGNKKPFLTLFAFVLFFYSFCFIATSIPSGGRFLFIAHLFLAIMLVTLYSHYSKRNIKNLIIFALPVFLFNIVFINLILPILILTPTFWFGNLFWILGEGLNFKLI